MTEPTIAPPQDAAGSLPAMALMDHLRELRWRILWSLLALVVGMAVSFVFLGRRVMDGLLAICGPDCAFQAIEPLERLRTWLDISFMLGFAVASPFILYHLVAFIVPALHRHERRYLYLFLPGAGILFVLGLSFGYFLVLPRTIGFLVGFMSGETLGPGGAPLIATQLRISTYVAFLTNLLWVLGLAFQMPLVVFLLSKIGILTPRIMSRYRRQAILVMAIVAAALTPTPDPFTMMMVMVPMYLLYEAGGLLARVM